jgi:quercetin 2,3-dioxygenase
MSNIIYFPKEKQQLMPLFGGAFIENKPIPFPEAFSSQAYSSLFYWAHLEANETSEFPLHPHKGFEIMTFIFEGSLEHYDTATKVWTPLNAGGAQAIQANSGVYHAERITKGSRLFQIWFDPGFSKSMKMLPLYKDYQYNSFEKKNINNIDTIEYVGENGSIDSITEGLSIKKMDVKRGKLSIMIKPTSTYSFYLLEGAMRINNENIEKDGFLIIKDETELALYVQKSSELFMIETPTAISYKRYIDRM